MRFPTVLSQDERSILLAMYKVQNGTYTSYSLAWELYPTVEKGTALAAAAFAGTRDSTEQLIVRGLVRGERFNGADGVYFNNLKLTPKGEQTAIQQRAIAEEEARALDQAVKDADATTTAIRNFKS